MNSSASPSSVRRSASSFEHRGLDGDVERRGDLVADDQIWFGCECAGDCDPLALTARDLAGISAADAGREAYQLEQPSDLAVDVRRARCAEARAAGRSALATVWSGLSDALGFWKTIWIAAAMLERPLPGAAGERLAVEQDPAGVGQVQAGDTAGDCRLTAPRLADERQRLSVADRERHRAAITVLRRLR